MEVEGEEGLGLRVGKSGQTGGIRTRGEVRGHVWADGKSGCRDEERSWAAGRPKAEKPLEGEQGQSGSPRPGRWNGQCSGFWNGEPH